MAVLLDNFVSASSAIEEEEAQILLEDKRRRQLVKNPLEPLLKKIAREFVDDTDLSNKIHHLYKVCWVTLDSMMMFCSEGMGAGQVLDTDGSGSLSSSEFCASIKKLVYHQVSPILLSFPEPLT